MATGYIKFFRVLAIAISLWVIWAIWGREIASCLLSSDNGLTDKQLVDWADSFGAFNALVSALGFAAVLATLLVQAESLKAQVRDQHYQRFETTFFELLRIMQDKKSQIRIKHSIEYVKSIKFKSPVKNSTGDEALKKARDEIRFHLDNQQQVDTIYNEYFKKSNELTWTPYFRILFTILQKIKNYTYLTEDHKSEFADLLSCMMTGDETRIVALYGLSNEAGDFKKLIDEFSMLKYLPETGMREELKKHYQCKAFHIGKLCMACQNQVGDPVPNSRA